MELARKHVRTEAPRLLRRRTTVGLEFDHKVTGGFERFGRDLHLHPQLLDHNTRLPLRHNPAITGRIIAKCPDCLRYLPLFCQSYQKHYWSGLKLQEPHILILYCSSCQLAFVFVRSHCSNSILSASIWLQQRSAEQHDTPWT